MLELSGTAAGTLTGLGTEFTNFSSIAVDQSANWILSGANTLAAGTALSIGASGTLTNNGSLSITGSADISGTGSFVNSGTFAKPDTGEVDVGTAFINSALVSVGSGTIEFLAPVDGTGTFVIQSGATADFGKGFAATAIQNATFPVVASQQTELDLGNPSTFHGTIANFGTMDKIDLLNTPAKSLSYAGGELTVRNSGGATVATLSFQGSYVTKDFALHSDGNGGTFITTTHP